MLDLKPQQYVILDSTPIQEIVPLQHVAGVAACRSARTVLALILRTVPIECMSQHLDPAAARRKYAGKHGQQRCLSAARRAYDGGEIPPSEIDADILYCERFGVGLMVYQEHVLKPCNNIFHNPSKLSLFIQIIRVLGRVCRDLMIMGNLIMLCSKD